MLRIGDERVRELVELPLPRQLRDLVRLDLLARLDLLHRLQRRVPGLDRRVPEAGDRLADARLGVR
jgi:hypothetical protein